MTEQPEIELCEALAVLKVGRTFLLEHLKTHAYYRRAGRRYVFSAEHIEALKLSIHEASESKRGSQCRSRSKNAGASGMSGARSEAKVSSKLRALLNATKPNSAGRSGKRSYMKDRSSAGVLPFPSSERP